MLVSGGRFGPWVVSLLVLSAPALGAQSEYYNLDAGRATRVEDALPTERYALDLALGGLRFDRLASGMQRWRSEPKLTYGLLPFTEIELRLPIIYSANPTTHATSSGLGGLAVGVMHAFNLETRHVPALALSTEVVLPSGSQFGAPSASYSLKGIATHTSSLGRFHLNAGIGSYSVRAVSWTDTTTCLAPPSQPKTCYSKLTVFTVPPDLPCIREQKEPAEDAAQRPVGPPPPPPGTDTTTEIRNRSTRAHGDRWLLGAGMDRAFPLRSLLISGDVYAERFVGLYPGVDWTAEIGARHQLSPRFILDVGVMRKFAGTVLSTAGSFGLSYELSTRRR
jgi:hypothetical protein